MRRFAFLLLSTILLQAAASQGYHFMHYGMEHGLASNEVYGVTQDRTGFLWIATNNGLQRFDGVMFRTFRNEPANPLSLPSNFIMEVMVDAKDRLWVVGYGGNVGLFNKSAFTYKGVPALTRVPNAVEFSEKRLIRDEFGNVFLCLRGGDLLRYDEGKGAFVPVRGFLSVDTAWGYTSLSQQPGTQKYWMGLKTGGLVIHDRKTGLTSLTGRNVAAEPAVDIFGPRSDFAYSRFDAKGRVWFQAWGKGYPLCMQYDPRRRERPLRQHDFYAGLKTYHELRGITELSCGQVWVFGAKLLAFFNEAEERFELVPSSYNNGHGIVYDGITGMYEDRQHNVWLATQDHGLYCFNAERQYFTNVYHRSRERREGVGEGGVMSFAQLRNGDILAGSWEDGLFRYTSDLKNVPLGFRNSDSNIAFIWDMCPSADSNAIWMAAQPGLYLYSQTDNTTWYRNPPALRGKTIRQVAEDGSGNLWLGMHGIGVYRWIDPKNRRRDSIVRVEAVGDAMVNKVMADTKGMVWVGTEHKGLFLFDGRSGQLIRHWQAGGDAEGRRIGNTVQGLLEYNDSLTIVATLNQLFLYNHNTGRLSDRRLPGNLVGFISSLALDDKGFVWVSTTNALYRTHPLNGAILMFNRHDGIGSDRFTLAASHRLRDGRLLFGNANAFIAFNPLKMGITAQPPPVYITGIQVGRRELPVDSVMALKRLVLSPEDNYITVNVSTLQLATGQAIQYRMEGIDAEWRTADGLKRISYPYLPAGRHTLLLRSVSEEGTFSKPLALNLRVRSPWYQSWWFYTLLALAFIAELWWLDRQRNLRKRGLQSMRTNIWGNLHREVIEALNNINILSEIARLKSEREPRKAQEYLEQIHSKSHNMILAMDDMLWSLDPENDAMDKAVSRIREYADDLMQRHKVLIELLIDSRVERLELNMRLRHESLLLFKEGLRSLVEAGTPHCIVHVAAERSRLLFTIEFANEGCDMQQLNNLLHRRDMELRLQELNAKLDVQLHKSRSVFLLQLPLG